MTDPCLTPQDNQLLSVAQAKEKILDAIEALTEFETIPLAHCMGRFLAEDICSTINVPSWDNSAMDGYAICFHADGSLADKPYQVIGKVMAGDSSVLALTPGQAARIMTGAPVPKGTSSVVMQEHATLLGENLQVPTRIGLGDNIRRAGEDIEIGKTILRKGDLLTPPRIGLLASVGFSQVTVSRKINISLFSTGNEIKEPGEKLSEGQIYDTNRYVLKSFLSSLPVNIQDLGILKDDQAEIHAALQQASKNSDLIITSGGVSVGDADFVKQTLESLGSLSFWKIAMKPGKPLAFGHIGEALFLGLPGNPVSTTVTFLLFAKPSITKLSGGTEHQNLRLKLRTTSELRKSVGRQEFQRGIMEEGANGEWLVRTTGRQGSHVLSSMAVANCLIDLPADSEGTEINEWVDVIPLNQC
ncbi:MAG: molybdopterin molybdotransferase MoeA [Gammaproteobacteria bacterium]|nr:molybdopterin molybdotransferase MoeA [Gammaproteobacteria bacterium]